MRGVPRFQGRKKTLPKDALNTLLNGVWHVFMMMGVVSGGGGGGSEMVETTCGGSRAHA